MVYGVLRFINFAHSDVFMVGAFAGFYIGRGMPKESFATGFAALAGAMVYLVIFASLLAVSAWHYLLRHGGATRVTSLIYLTPIFAVVLEYAMFDVVPGALSLAGIAITCTGVAMVTGPQRVASG